MGITSSPFLYYLIDLKLKVIGTFLYHFRTAYRLYLEVLQRWYNSHPIRKYLYHLITTIVIGYILKNIEVAYNQRFLEMKISKSFPPLFLLDEAFSCVNCSLNDR